MSGEQWGEAVDAAALAMYGTPRLAERNRDMAERAVRAAAELIVADTRRKVAEEIRAEGERLTTGHWEIHGIGYAHAARWLTDQNHAIARGSGNGDSDTSKPTGSRPI